MVLISHQKPQSNSRNCIFGKSSQSTLRVKNSNEAKNSEKYVILSFERRGGPLKRCQKRRKLKHPPPPPPASLFSSDTHLARIRHLPPPRGTRPQSRRMRELVRVDALRLTDTAPVLLPPARRAVSSLQWRHGLTGYIIPPWPVHHSPTHLFPCNFTFARLFALSFCFFIRYVSAIDATREKVLFIYTRGKTRVRATARGLHQA